MITALMIHKKNQNPNMNKIILHINQDKKDNPVFIHIFANVISLGQFAFI